MFTCCSNQGEVTQHILCITAMHLLWGRGVSCLPFISRICNPSVWIEFAKLKSAFLTVLAITFFNRNIFNMAVYIVHTRVNKVRGFQKNQSTYEDAVSIENIHNEEWQQMSLLNNLYLVAVLSMHIYVCVHCWSLVAFSQSRFTT